MLLAAVLLSLVSVGWGGWALLARSGGLFLRLGLAPALSSRRLCGGCLALPRWGRRGDGGLRPRMSGSYGAPGRCGGDLGVSRCFPGSLS
jgi:hypothetical protein